MRPRLLRPPCSRLPTVKALTGPPFHSSLRSIRTVCRRVGVTGRNVLSAIALDSRGHVDLRPFGQSDDRLLVVGAPAGAAAHHLALALDPHGVDGLDLDLEQALDRRLDRTLV